MKHYTCYLYDRDQHTAKVETADQPDDRAAVNWARLRLRANPQYPTIQVWAGDRLVYDEGEKRAP